MTPDGECSRCSAPIKWVIQTTGSLQPLDPDPRADGNIVLTGLTRPHGVRENVPEVRVLTKAERDATGALALDYGSRYVTHFATCPNARDFRKGRS